MVVIAGVVVQEVTESITRVRGRGHPTNHTNDLVVRPTLFAGWQLLNQVWMVKRPRQADSTNQLHHQWTFTFEGLQVPDAEALVDDGVKVGRVEPIAVHQRNEVIEGPLVAHKE